MLKLRCLCARFGWTNSSFIVGLSLLDDSAKAALGACVPYDVYQAGKKGVK